MNKYSFKNIDLTNFLFLLLTPITAVTLVLNWVHADGFNWGQVLLASVLYFVTGMSITAGYHRLFAHKAYDVHPLVKLIFLIFGAAAFQNSVLKWASDHRLHHAKVDSSEDPYSIEEGFFHAHMGWVILKKNGEIKDRYARDFLSDKMILWQHNYYFFIAVVAGLILPALLGQYFFDSWLGGLAVGGFARVVFVHHCTFFINSLCHYIGTTPYTDTNSAKDSWFMALLTFGEGYHNFHHFFQTDYRNGIRWYHFDPTKWLIGILNSSGLATKLKRTSHEKILAARMQMKIKNLNDKIAADSKFQNEIDALKSRVLESLKTFQELKNQYKMTKAKEIRERMLKAKSDFHSTLEAWDLYLRYLQASHAFLR